MSTRLSEVLKQHLVTQVLEAMGRGQPQPTWVFCNEMGNMVDPDNLRHRMFYRLLEKTGIRRIRIHDLRHTFATRLLMNGESPAYVKEQMGHSSIQVTVDLYCHWIPGSNRQAVDRLDIPLNLQKSQGESATIRNQTADVQMEKERFPSQVIGIAGAGDWNRTNDLRFTKPLLYQLSYAGTLVKQKKDGRDLVRHDNGHPANLSMKQTRLISTLRSNLPRIGNHS